MKLGTVRYVFLLFFSSDALSLIPMMLRGVDRIHQIDPFFILRNAVLGPDGLEMGDTPNKLSKTN